MTDKSLGGSMGIVITQWALDSYLDLKHSSVFSSIEYKNIIRPDVLLLNQFPNSPKFSNSKFWSLASMGSVVVSQGFKMKWHNVGNGKIQLRLAVANFSDFFLCQAYVKENSSLDRREIAKLKTRIQLIAQGKFIACGRLV